MKSMKAVLAAAFVLVSGAASAMDMTIHGSTTVNTNLFEPHGAALEQATGMKLNVVANGSSRGISGLDSGAANMGMISADLFSVLGKLKMTDRAAEFTATQVGEERIIFSVHPSNAVTTLTKDQVVSILKGETTNWNQVGGADADIVVVTEYSGGGFRTTVEKKLLDGGNISAPQLRGLPNGPQAVTVGQQLPNALTVAPSAMIKGTNLKKLETEVEIVQPLNLVTKGAPNAEQQKLIDAAKQILSN